MADLEVLEPGRLSRLVAQADEEWLLVLRRSGKKEVWQKKRSARLRAKETETFIRGLDELNRPSVADRLEFTNLDFKATSKDIRKLCFDALENKIGAVCVSPVWTSLAVSLVAQRARVVSTLDFPLGQNKTAVKVRQALESCQDGAVELDLAANHSFLVENNLAEFFGDIAAVKGALWEGVGLKVILEFSLLSPEQKVLGALGAFYAGADWIKTSTGVLGKTERQDVELLFRIFGPSFPIKAAGGIRTRQDLEMMYEAGAERFGTSTAVSILREL